ncbi:hypothetical protein BC332_10172 [Capsicum chinense]|nr:hypothetical protein BC332_10172 [Capsicum chinense]
MKVATSINPNMATMNTIDISDDDRDVSIKYSNSKSSKRKCANDITDPIFVEEYVEKSKKKVLIDLFDDKEDEIQLFNEGCSNLLNFSKSYETFMCEICVDEKPMTQNFKIMGCNHSYCHACTINYIASKLQQNITRISCPVPGCIGNYEPHYCRSILPKQVFDRWGDALCESMILESDKFYCPYKTCSALLINENRGRILSNKGSKCPNCKKLFCPNCKVPWHKGFSCEEFQKLQENDEGGRDDIALLKLAKRRRWQRCPRCRIYVARTKGCPHMHCSVHGPWCLGAPVPIAPRGHWCTMHDTHGPWCLGVDATFVTNVEMSYHLVTIAHEGNGENVEDVMHRSSVGRLKWRLALRVLCDKKVPPKLKGKLYRVAVRPTMLYEAECWPAMNFHIQKLKVTKMKMLLWMCGLTRVRKEIIRKNVEVTPVEDKMPKVRLR